MTITSVSKGNVLTYSTYGGQLYGVKVMDYTYTVIDGVEQKLFITQSGKVVDGEWVFSKGTEYIGVYTEEDLKSNYTDKWIKSPFKKGDFLISDGDDKVVFYFESSDKVWRMTKGTWNNGSTYTSLASREANFGKLRLFTTHNGDSFAKVVDGTHLS